MYSVDRIVGRLIETRITSPLPEGEVEAIIQGVRMNVIAQPGKVICVSDLTRLDGLTPEAVEAFTAMFTRDNPKIERSALLLGRADSALALQIGRMVRAAKSTSRLAFDDPTALRIWLDQVLDAGEKTRLRVFLQKIDAPAPSSRRVAPPSSKSRLPMEPLVPPPSSKPSRRS
jgi:hypothetical protein